MIVYFIKHRGQSPIKIGYTDNISKRMYQFQNVSPWGIELIGTIETENACELEKELHDRFKKSRLRGEWFSISIDQVMDIISMYQGKEYIDAKNKFEIEFANRNNPIYIPESKDVDLGLSLIRTDTHPYVHYLNQSEICEIFNLDKMSVREYIKSIGAVIKTKRIDRSKVKNCYELYSNEEVF